METNTKMFITCNGRIQSNGYCDTCGQLGEIRTSSVICGRLIECAVKLGRDNPVEQKDVPKGEILKKHMQEYISWLTPTLYEAIISAMQEYSSTQRQQARNEAIQEALQKLDLFMEKAGKYPTSKNEAVMSWLVGFKSELEKLKNLTP